MIRIVLFEPIHQDSINRMMDKINQEFVIDILPQQSAATPVIPDHYWVALNNEEVIGTVGLLVLAKNRAVLKKMMLTKEYRGQNLGISKMLLNTAIDCCKSNGITDLYLGTMSQFEAAKSFYFKNGFIQISKKELPSNFPFNPLDTVFFKYNF